MSTTPVGLSRDLPAQRVMRAQVGYEDLAIWRGASGRLQAWHNRCPHRGMRLSFGFVRGDSLACAYHGWHFNCDAVCHYIPAHPALKPPTTIKPIAFSVVEQNELLWVNTSGEATPPGLPDDLVGVRSIFLDCPCSTAVASFQAAELKDEAGNNLSVTQFSDSPIGLSYGRQADSDAVLLLFQPAADITTVHVLASSNWSVAGRVGLSRWCETVRRKAEQDNE